MITKDDILNVARDLNKNLSEIEVDYILRNYLGWQASLPMDPWNIVIEDMIYFLEKYPDAVFEEDASTDDCYFDREDDEVFDDSEERRDFGNDDDDETLIGMGGQIV